VWRLLTTHYNDSSTVSLTAESTLDSKEARDVSFASPSGPDRHRVSHSLLLPKRTGDSLTRGLIGKVCSSPHLTPRLRNGGAIPPLLFPTTSSCRSSEQSTGRRTPAAPRVVWRNRKTRGVIWTGRFYWVKDMTKKDQLEDQRRRQDNIKTNLQEIGRDSV